jgi:hypothetical protein
VATLSQRSAELLQLLPDGPRQRHEHSRLAHLNCGVHLGRDVFVRWDTEEVVHLQIAEPLRVEK